MAASVPSAGRYKPVAPPAVLTHLRPSGHLRPGRASLGASLSLSGSTPRVPAGFLALQEEVLRACPVRAGPDPEPVFLPGGATTRPDTAVLSPGRLALTVSSVVRGRRYSVQERTQWEFTPTFAASAECRGLPRLPRFVCGPLSSPAETPTVKGGDITFRLPPPPTPLSVPE